MRVWVARRNTGRKRTGSIDELDLVRPVGLLDRMHRLAGIGHGIDHVPDEFPLHLPFGPWHIDPHQAYGLEAEIQRPDVVAKGNFLGPIEVLVHRQQLDGVVPGDGFVQAAIRIDVFDDAGGELAIGGIGRRRLLCRG